MLNDLSQNISSRIGTIQIAAFVLLALLGARLYILQIVKGEYYTNKAENQRIRIIRIPAQRGAILDRNGKLLVDSHPIYNVTITHEPFKGGDPLARIDDYASGLGTDRETLIERLDWIKKQPEYEMVVIKENASFEDLAWVDSHRLEYPELDIQPHSQRRYPNGTLLAHALGYVGEISPKQLDSDEFKNRGLKPGDVIGKSGLEAAYDEQLRGVSGYRKVLVDSRGRVKSELEVVQPQSGQDLITTIDIDLQRAAEEQLAKSNTKRGTIIAMDPNNGEVLAMASAPGFDPNVFVMQNVDSKSRETLAKYYTDTERPLLNRAIQGRYHPGSTWKIPEAVAALQQGIITPDDNAILCGGGITIGNKHTRCMGNHGVPPLRFAITKSCDGYFYRLGLKMGVDGMIKMIDEFEYEQPTGIDLPNEKISRTPKYYRPLKEQQLGRWPDIETVFASIGQVTVEVTPISMLRAVASIGVGGKMYVPHLMKEFREIGGVGDPDKPSTFHPPKQGAEYPMREPKIIPMTAEQNRMVVEGMWGVVNNGGTGQSIMMSSLEIAGKTGTAQNSALGSGGAKDHAWFVSFAPAYKPEIAVIAMIENAGFGAANAAPAVKGIYEVYVAKRDGTIVAN